MKWDCVAGVNHGAEDRKSGGGLIGCRESRSWKLYDRGVPAPTGLCWTDLATWSSVAAQTGSPFRIKERLFLPLSRPFLTSALLCRVVLPVPQTTTANKIPAADESIMMKHENSSVFHGLSLLS